MEQHPQLSWPERGQLWLRLTIRLVLTVAAVLLFFLVGLPLLSLLFPFVLALIVAWCLNPAVRWLQHKLPLNRKAISMVLIILVFAVIGGVLFGVGWVAVSQITSLFDNRQSLLESLMNGLDALWANVSGWLDEIGKFIPLPPELVSSGEGFLELLTRWFQSLDISGWLTRLMNHAPDLVSNISGFLVALIVFVMASYFITGEYPRYRFQVTDRMPAEVRGFTRSARNICVAAFGGYLKSQLLMSMVVLLILTVGFMIMGNSYGLLIAFGLAVLDFIPIVGSGTVMVPWAVIDLILGHYLSAIQLMLIWGVIALFRQLAGPKVLGDQTGLSPILSLLGIYVGMKAGGVLGMVFGPLILLVIINLGKLGIFRPAMDDIRLAVSDTMAILRAGRKPRSEDGGRTGPPAGT